MLLQALLLFSLIDFSLTATTHRGAPRHYVNASQVVETQELESPYPYVFPVLQNGSMVNSGTFPMPLCHGLKLEEATIDQLQQALSNGTLSSVKLALCYMKRIYQVDGYIRYCSPSIYLQRLTNYLEQSWK
jgi:amidase